MFCIGLSYTIVTIKGYNKTLTVTLLEHFEKYPLFIDINAILVCLS